LSFISFQLSVEIAINSFDLDGYKNASITQLLKTSEQGKAINIDRTTSVRMTIAVRPMQAAKAKWSPLRCQLLTKAAPKSLNEPYFNNGM
jgi:hypothetical protein